MGRRVERTSSFTSRDRWTFPSLSSTRRGGIYLNSRIFRLSPEPCIGQDYIHMPLHGLFLPGSTTANLLTYVPRSQFSDLATAMACLSYGVPSGLPALPVVTNAASKHSVVPADGVGLPEPARLWTFRTHRGASRTSRLLFQFKMVAIVGAPLAFCGTAISYKEGT